MDDRFEPKDPSRRVKAVLIVIVLHVLLAYVLVSGLARQGLSAINKPLEAVVIQEVIIPPSPSTPPPTPAPKETRKPQEVLKREAPPPPSMPPSDAAPEASSTAPVVASVAPAPTAPAAVSALPPAPSPVGPPGPKRTSIGLACPTQVPPEMPRKALQEGIEGVVKAQIHVKDGTILDVTILSGPRVFHAAVKAAMLQYRCVTDGGEVTATQEFTFRLE
ncbi:energy transducer TonB [Rhodoferax ferrireducens]|uniref:energy transducer TonB n=1 Tax=Rhodoferax ferrireducens TaxID=192843 RepID=UPI00298E253A|nr:energy transducer TonB [Rhodoferax ferrireducens]WPC65965.1 energy transducer TonB [Rhodoferax ferrireducens]